MLNYLSLNYKQTITQEWNSCNQSLFDFLNNSAIEHQRNKTPKDKLRCWSTAMNTGSKSNKPDFSKMRLVVLDIDWSTKVKDAIKQGKDIPKDQSDTMSQIEKSLRDSPVVWFVYRSFSDGLRFGVLTKSPLNDEAIAKETAVSIVIRLIAETDIPNLLTDTNSINVDSGKLNQKCLWYVPNDPDKIWFRDEAIQVEPVKPNVEEVKTLELLSSAQPQDTFNAATAAIEVIEQHGDGFPIYDEYLKMVFAAKSSGVSAIDAARLFHKCPKFDQKHFDKTWSNAKSSGVTVGTLIWYAKKNFPQAWNAACKLHKVTIQFDSGLPAIEVNNRHPNDVSDDISNALSVNPESMLFSYCGVPATITESHGHHRITCLTGDSLRNHITRFIQPMRVNATGSTICMLPNDIASFIETNEKSKNQFPEVKGISTVPIARKDGSIFTDDNRVDPETHLFFSNHKLNDWSKAMSSSQELKNPAKAAAKFLLDMVSDFPFKNESSKANYLAFLLTFPTRHWYADSPVPVCMITANSAGVGKSTLVGIGTTLAYGSPVPSIKDFKNEQEARKQITSRIREGSKFVLLDNADEGKPIGGAWFDEMITSGRYRDRILGTNTTIESTIDAYAVTTNGVKLAADGGRRFYFVELETNLTEPHKRSDFKVKDILAHAKKKRFAYNAALLVMIQAWCKAGCPDGKGQTFGSFESWCEVIDGILAFAGVNGFLENRDSIATQADEVRNDQLMMMEAIYPMPYTNGFFTATFAEECKQNDDLLKKLPEWLSAKSNENTFAKSVGNLISKMTNKPILCGDKVTRKIVRSVRNGKTRYSVVTI